MAKLFKTLLVLLVLAAVAAGLYAFARSNKDDQGNKLVTVETGSIKEKAIPTGQIQPGRSSPSSPRSPASSGLSASEYERAQELPRSGGLPKADLDTKREAFELGEVALARAEQSRQLTRKGHVESARGRVDSVIRAPAALHVRA